MARPQLRIYYGPQSESSRDASVTGSELSDKAEQVTVPLRDIFPVLADAIRHKRTWLCDFADEDISVSTDLYEVILAYQHYRRPSA